MKKGNSIHKFELSIYNHTENGLWYHTSKFGISYIFVIVRFLNVIMMLKQTSLHQFLLTNIYSLKKTFIIGKEIGYREETFILKIKFLIINCIIVDQFPVIKASGPIV